MNDVDDEVSRKSREKEHPRKNHTPEKILSTPKRDHKLSRMRNRSRMCSRSRMRSRSRTRSRSHVRSLKDRQEDLELERQRLRVLESQLQRERSARIFWSRSDVENRSSAVEDGTWKIMTPGDRGSFEIEVNDKLIYSKLQTMALPDYQEVAQVVHEVSLGAEPTVIKQQQPIDCVIS